MRWKIPSSVPSRIAASDPPVQSRNMRSSRTSSENTERRSSRVVSEKTTLPIAKVVRPIVRAIALS